MKDAVVTKNLRTIVENVGKELANAPHIFGSEFPQNVDLEKEWKTYMKDLLTNMDTKAQAWANKYVDKAIQDVENEDTKMDTLMKGLKLKEQQATAAYVQTQQAKYKKLSDQITKYKALVKTTAKRITSLEKMRKASPSKQLTAQIKSQKKAWQSRVETLSVAERERAKLYSTGVANIIEDLKEDLVILKGYKAKIAGEMQMPTI